MDYITEVKLIKDILTGWTNEEMLPADSDKLISRLIQDLKYDGTIKKRTLKHLQDCFGHLFE